jgi:hypothetical protein
VPQVEEHWYKLYLVQGWKEMNRIMIRVTEAGGKINRKLSGLIS